MDFDPRWTDDSRDRDDYGRELSQGSRDGTSHSHEHPSPDPREVFTRDLDLPRGPNRERVRVRGHHVTLRGSESRTLATVGAFRVVNADDLRDGRGRPLVPRDGDLKHLKRERLVETIPVRDGRALVVLTEKGRDVLESHRREPARFPDVAKARRERSKPRQEFYAGRQRPRELLHDAQVYRAYEREAERLRENETLHYRGDHAAAKASSGFSRHSGSTMRVVGARGAGGAGGRRGSGGRGMATHAAGKSGGRAFDQRIAEELLG